eukprot:TRINITY_DN613_c0_g3_i1.p1 TRINITY_DN613_c0_g3~~TRINITY_DN613_c0_g3_i1.p1  ORF type:complete len:767 (-),score=164.89 TRINITY_DN613_c0_g3_i1:406-2706(-)
MSGAKSQFWRRAQRKRSTPGSGSGNIGLARSDDKWDEEEAEPLFYGDSSAKKHHSRSKKGAQQQPVYVAYGGPGGPRPPSYPYFDHDYDRDHRRYGGGRSADQSYSYFCCCFLFFMSLCLLLFSALLLFGAVGLVALMTGHMGASAGGGAQHPGGTATSLSSDYLGHLGGSGALLSPIASLVSGDGGTGGVQQQQQVARPQDVSDLKGGEEEVTPETKQGLPDAVSQQEGAQQQQQQEQQQQPEPEVEQQQKPQPQDEQQQEQQQQLQQTEPQALPDFNPDPQPNEKAMTAAAQAQEQQLQQQRQQEQQLQQQLQQQLEQQPEEVTSVRQPDVIKGNNYGDPDRAHQGSIADVQIKGMSRAQLDKILAEEAAQEEANKKELELINAMLGQVVNVQPKAEPQTLGHGAQSVTGAGGVQGQPQVIVASTREEYHRHNFILFTPFHSQEAWPYLYPVTPFRSVCTRRSAVQPKKYNDVYAYDVLPVLEDVEYSQLLLEFGAMFAVDASREELMTGLPWIGFQHWEARKAGFDLSPAAIQSLDNTLAPEDNSPPPGRDVFYYWLPTQYSSSADGLYSSCDRVYGKCSLVISSTLEELFTSREFVGSGVDVTTLRVNPVFLPPMPGAGKGFARSSNWVMDITEFHDFMSFLRMFVVTMETLWDVHSDSDKCPLSLVDGADASVDSGYRSNCWSIVMDRLVNIWVYHRGLHINFIDPVTGEVSEQYPIASRKMWKDKFSPNVMSTLVASFPWRLSAKASALLKGLEGPTVRR